MVSPALSTTRRGVLRLSVAAMIGVAPREAGAAPDGQLRIGAHVSLAPTWFDPAETSGIITPFMLLYAMHDAVLKAMPDASLFAVMPDDPDGDTFADNIVIYLDHVQRHLGMIEALRGLQGTAGTATN